MQDGHCGFPLMVTALVVGAEQVAHVVAVRQKVGDGVKKRR